MMNVAFLAVRAAELVNQRLLEKRKTWGINPTQVLILSVLRMSALRQWQKKKCAGMSVSDIASRTSCTVSTVSHQLGNLTSKGWVALAADAAATDLRTRLYQLTPAGRAKADDCQQELEDIAKLMRSVLGSAAAKDMKSGLSDIVMRLPKLGPLTYKGSARSIQLDEIRRRQEANRASGRKGTKS